MASNPTLKFPADPTTSLFRVLDLQWRADPTLAAAVKVWQSWEGGGADAVAPSLDQCPWVRLTPRYGPDDWWAASTMSGWLYVNVELWVRGSCYDDLSNLWGALQRACYAADPVAQQAFARRLFAAGARTGLPKFNRPVIVNQPADDGYIAGAGWVAVEYRYDLHPRAPGN